MTHLTIGGTNAMEKVTINKSYTFIVCSYTADRDFVSVGGCVGKEGRRDWQARCIIVPHKFC
jgi:hypothetical protein